MDHVETFLTQSAILWRGYQDLTTMNRGRESAPEDIKMSSSAIVFSAQFGGRDAAQALLPHFKALKVAAIEFPLKGFPFAELGFIFRVDGEVNTYGFSGAGDLEIDKDSKYIAIDIGIDLFHRQVRLFSSATSDGLGGWVG